MSRRTKRIAVGLIMVLLLFSILPVNQAFAASLSASVQSAKTVTPGNSVTVRVQGTVSGYKEVYPQLYCGNTTYGTKGAVMKPYAGAFEKYDNNYTISGSQTANLTPGTYTVKLVGKTSEGKISSTKVCDIKISSPSVSPTTLSAKTVIPGNAVTVRVQGNITGRATSWPELVKGGVTYVTGASMVSTSTYSRYDNSFTISATKTASLTPGTYQVMLKAKTPAGTTVAAKVCDITIKAPSVTATELSAKYVTPGNAVTVRVQGNALGCKTLCPVLYKNGSPVKRSNGYNLCGSSMTFTADQYTSTCRYDNNFTITEADTAGLTPGTYQVMLTARTVKEDLIIDKVCDLTITKPSLTLSTQTAKYVNPGHAITVRVQGNAMGCKAICPVLYKDGKPCVDGQYNICGSTMTFTSDKYTSTCRYDNDFTISEARTKKLGPGKYTVMLTARTIDDVLLTKEVCELNIVEPSVSVTEQDPKYVTPGKPINISVKGSAEGCKDICPVLYKGENPVKRLSTGYNICGTTVSSTGSMTSYNKTFQITAEDTANLKADTYTVMLTGRTLGGKLLLKEVCKLTVTEFTVKLISPLTSNANTNTRTTFLLEDECYDVVVQAGSNAAEAEFLSKNNAVYLELWYRNNLGVWQIIDNAKLRPVLLKWDGKTTKFTGTLKLNQYLPSGYEYYASNGYLMGGFELRAVIKLNGDYYGQDVHNADIPGSLSDYSSKDESFEYYGPDNNSFYSPCVPGGTNCAGYVLGLDKQINPEIPNVCDEAKAMGVLYYKDDKTTFTREDILLDPDLKAGLLSGEYRAIIFYKGDKPPITATGFAQESEERKDPSEYAGNPGPSSTHFSYVETWNESTMQPLTVLHQLPSTPSWRSSYENGSPFKNYGGTGEYPNFYIIIKN